MGEYAEMMLDGTCCSCCGEWLGGDGAGWAIMCAACAMDAPIVTEYGVDPNAAPRPLKRAKLQGKALANQMAAHAKRSAQRAKKRAKKNAERKRRPKHAEG